MTYQPIDYLLAVPLEFSMLCSDCSLITDSRQDAGKCPVCTSSSVMPLQTWLDFQPTLLISREL